MQHHAFAAPAAAVFSYSTTQRPSFSPALIPLRVPGQLFAVHTLCGIRSLGALRLPDRLGPDGSPHFLPFVIMFDYFEYFLCHVWPLLPIFCKFWQFWPFLTIINHFWQILPFQTMLDHFWHFWPFLIAFDRVIGRGIMWRGRGGAEEYGFLGVFDHFCHFWLFLPFLPFLTIF